MPALFFLVIRVAAGLDIDSNCIPRFIHLRQRGHLTCAPHFRFSFYMKTILYNFYIPYRLQCQILHHSRDPITHRK